MADIKQAEDGDLLIENGDLQIVVGIDGIKQDLHQRLGCFVNEWFLDLSDGLPYYESILVKNPSSQVVEGIFQDRILSTPGVLEILSFNFDYDPKARSLKVEFEARCQDGIIEYSEVLGG